MGAVKNFYWDEIVDSYNTCPDCGSDLVLDTPDEVPVTIDRFGKQVLTSSDAHTHWCDDCDKGFVFEYEACAFVNLDVVDDRGNEP